MGKNLEKRNLVQAYLGASQDETPHLGKFATTWGLYWGPMSVPKWLRLWRADANRTHEMLKCKPDYTTIHS